MDVDSSSKSGASSMVPLGIGLLGLVIGVIALFVALNGASKAQLGTLNDAVTDAANKATEAKTTADGLAAKVDANTNLINGIRSGVQDYINQTNTVLEQYKNDIASLKTSPRASASRSGGGTAGGTESTTVGPNGGTYTIQAGDYFSSLAKKFGVTVKEIEEANPGVDSSHLRIGQKITIPPHSARSSSPPAPTTSAAPAPTASTSPAPAVSP